MTQDQDRRCELRYRYHWPVWFTSEPQYGELSQGQMVDVTSHAAAFTCYADGQCPYPNQYLATRFSVPRYGVDGSFDMTDFTRSGHVCRVDEVSGHLRRVVVQFHEPLPFRPGEQAESTTETFGREPVLV